MVTTYLPLIAVALVRCPAALLMACPIVMPLKVLPEVLIDVLAEPPPQLAQLHNASVPSVDLKYTPPVAEFGMDTTKLPPLWLTATLLIYALTCALLAVSVTE
jgi:hypothetical protein